MGLGKKRYGGLPYEVVKTIRMCCCGKQLHIVPQDVQNLTMKSEWQLRNLAHTFKDEVEYQNIYDIREYFHDQSIPFRYQGCPRSSLTCCGSCTRMCKKRCPQDVLNRAYLYCANIICAPNEEEQKIRYENADTPVQMLYDELTASVPRYFAIAEMITHMISPYHNKKLEKTLEEVYGNENSPHRLDYAPAIAYELTPGSNPEEGKFRKKVNPETGEVIILEWPRSGMCPFCLPTGLSDRRRSK